MKIYNTEGQCISDTTDTEFGWSLNDIDSLNKSDRSYEYSVSIKKKFNESEKKILVYEPKIPIYRAKSAIESIVNEMPNRIKIESGIIPKDTLARLVEGDSLEAKALLSTIHQRKHFFNIASHTNVSNDLHYISQVGFSSDLSDNQNINLQFQGSSKNNLSLMAELTLAGEKIMHIFEQTTEQDSGIDCGDGFFIQDNELENNIKNCDYQTIRLQQEVQHLKRKYKVGFSD